MTATTRPPRRPRLLDTHPPRTGRRHAASFTVLREPDPQTPIPTDTCGTEDDDLTRRLLAQWAEARRRQEGPPDGLAVLIWPHHLPLPMVRALVRQAPMLLATGHESLYASALTSTSLPWESKAKVIEMGPSLSQFQADELATVLHDERAEFARLSSREGGTIATLQALSLWDSLEGVGELLGAGPALRAAWLRRTVRQAARGGALAAWLQTAMPQPSDWAAAGPLVRCVYRGALPADHPAWDPSDSDQALAQAAQDRRREHAQAAEEQRRRAERESRAQAEAAAESSWAE